MKTGVGTDVGGHPLLSGAVHIAEASSRTAAALVRAKMPEQLSSAASQCAYARWAKALS